jgi:hypothetical protein
MKYEMPRLLSVLLAIFTVMESTIQCDISRPRSSICPPRSIEIVAYLRSCHRKEIVVCGGVCGEVITTINNLTQERR